MEHCLLTQVIQELSQDEGRRSRAYDDATGKALPRLPTGGKRTIGVGWNLDDNEMPDEAIDLLLTIAIKRAEATAKKLVPGFEGLSRNRRAALINLSYNLGESRLRKFTNTLAAINREDWPAAARGLRKSLWARQVQPSRRDRVIQQIELG